MAIRYTKHHLKSSSKKTEMFKFSFSVNICFKINYGRSIFQIIKLEITKIKIDSTINVVCLKIRYGQNTNFFLYSEKHENSGFRIQGAGIKTGWLIWLKIILASAFIICSILLTGNSLGTRDPRTEKLVRADHEKIFIADRRRSRSPRTQRSLDPCLGLAIA